MTIDIYEGYSVQDKFEFIPSGRGMADLISETQRVPLTEDVLSKHLLYCGTTGCGKTTAINQLLDQLIPKMSGKDVMIIFDTKGDFRNRFYRPGKDKVLSNDGTATDNWNLFKEAQVDGEKRVGENLLEIAATLFDEKIRRSQNPFFPQAARDVFFGILMYLYNVNHTAHPGDLHNKELYHFLSDAGRDEVIDCFRKDTNLQGFIDYIYSGGGESEQAQGVYSEMRVVAHEIFQGNFREAGNFSIREFVRNKGGKILFVEYDISKGRILEPIYKCIVDLGIKEALSRTKSDGNVFFIIDEFKLLPNLSHIDDGINYGRGLGAKFVIAIQNIPQMLNAYGRERAESILSSFGTMIAFRMPDSESIRFVQSHFGRNRKRYTLRSTASYGAPDITDSGYGNAVEDWDLLGLTPGNAILCVSDYSPQPVRFHFKKGA